MSLLKNLFPTELSTPIIPLGSDFDKGIEILSTVSNEIIKDDSEEEIFYKAVGQLFSVGFYTDGEKITAAWYDDPLGRIWGIGIKKKIKLYLARYGEIKNWELRINNGWIKHFFNDTDNLHIAYGIHKDVIRVNSRD